MKGIAWLREQGLTRDTDYRASTVQNQDSIAHVLLSGEAAFGMLSSAEFLQIPSELRDRLMVFSQFVELPSFVTLVNGKRLAQDAEHIKSLLLRFPSSAPGEKFLALTGIKGVRAISASEMLALDVFAADSRRMLGSP
jgi:hypothetical protein